MPRWPGTEVPEEMHAAATRLEHDNPGWTVWVGSFTQHFHALHDGRMIVEPTAGMMAAAIARYTSAASSPGAAASEGVGRATGPGGLWRAPQRE